MDIRGVIEAERVKQGLSKRGLAGKAGMEPTRLCRFLNGTRGAHADTVSALCRVLGLKLESSHVRPNKRTRLVGSRRRG